MSRREFILGVGEVTVLAALPVARAQEAGRRYRIATLTNTPREVASRADEREWQAFLAELGHGGFGEGGNLDVDYRGFGVAPSSLEAMAIELTRARPDVIFATGPEAARAAQRATTSIAIVTLANDLVASGLVASMPHPEGNTTGVAIFAFQLDVKRLELLHEALPEARRIGILADREQVPTLSALNAAARDFGIEISTFTARSQEEIIQAIDAMRPSTLCRPIAGCRPETPRPCRRNVRDRDLTGHVADMSNPTLMTHSGLYGSRRRIASACSSISRTMSAADCVFDTRPTLCPAQRDIASMSPSASAPGV